MAESGIAPTPGNYEFWFRYVTGSDPDLVDAVDAIRRTTGKISTQAMVNIRVELFGGGERSGVVTLMDDTQHELARISSHVGKSEASARAFRGQLDRGQQALAVDAPADRHRALLGDIVEATTAMIARTASLEAELAESSNKISALKADLEIARTESRTDPLTGLANRKAGTDYLEAQVTRAKGEGRPLSLIYSDIDHFKNFNDCFGHRLGDEVLRLVGQSLERSFHGKGYVSRWGGEEFLVVLPGLECEEARVAAESFRTFVASRNVRSKDSQKDVGRITLSLGVAQIAAGESAAQLVDRADRALYCAKAEGRNRVVVDGNPLPAATAAAA